MIPEDSVRVTVVLRRDRLAMLQKVYREENGDYRNGAAATAVSYAARRMLDLREGDKMRRGIIKDCLAEIEAKRVGRAMERGGATTFVAAERADAAERAYDDAIRILRAVLG